MLLGLALALGSHYCSQLLQGTVSGPSCVAGAAARDKHH